MKYSLNWLKEHIAGALPQQEELVERITMRAFEIEEVLVVGGDILFEIKVLPNRAHDALSHRGMAREITQLFGLKTKLREYGETVLNTSDARVSVTIEDAVLCPRYIATRVDGVEVSASPAWLKEKLEAVGQRSINNIVDITNFILFDIGQPMHAFDADKVAGGITVRLAKTGEEMSTLDNKSLKFDGSELVIADDEGVLALAGVKGGKKAEVDASTKNIIFESANFHPTLTRRTSTKHNIKTDASKRFENEITSAFAGEGMTMALALIVKYGGAHVSPRLITDVYPIKEVAHTVTVSHEEVNRLLGLTLNTKEIQRVLNTLGLAYSEDFGKLNVTIPEERLDLRITADMVEEIGRNIGFDNIVATLPSNEKKGVPNNRLYYANKVRMFLIERGFSEVYTYSFAGMKSAIEVLNPVGDDRPYMREDIRGGLRMSIAMNAQNSPLVGLEHVDVFEFGNVFTKEGEQFHLALGSSKKKQDTGKILSEAITSIGGNTSGITKESGSESISQQTVEVDFGVIADALPVCVSDEKITRPAEVAVVVYKSFSRYPFITRDIALYVPAAIPESTPAELIKKEAGDLVVRFSQFDKYQKPGDERISYAYRIVFQSFERTLTDDEINKTMEKITRVCNANPGWEVR